MTKNEITIMKKVIYLIDQSLPFAKGSKVESVHNDEEEDYYKTLMAKCLNSTDVKRAEMNEEHQLYRVLPNNYEMFETFAGQIAEEIHTLQSENFCISAGDGVFLYVEAGEELYLFFLKLNYSNRFMHQVDEEGNIKLIENKIILPAKSQKCDEFFYINLNQRQAYISNIRHTINGMETNYLSRHVLELEADFSENEKVKIIQEAAVEIIEEYYPEEPKKLLEYKNAIAEKAEEKGTLEVEMIREVIFAENEEAREAFTETIKESGLKEEKVYLSPKTERQIRKKQKMVADNGIEILVPVEFLNRTDVIEYLQGTDGKITLMIKDIENLTNK